jgi:8-oxo-dGTP pyrophosphatase MutT (NUDIX family)
VIEVVSAVIVKHGRVLLQQRPALKEFPFTWECPGGKVEGDESHYRALRRELLEELGIDVGELPAGLLPVWTGSVGVHASEGKSRQCVHCLRNWVASGAPCDAEAAARYLLHFYAVGDAFTGDPRRLDGQPGLGWFLRDEMLALDLSPGNERAKSEIAREMQRRLLSDAEQYARRRDEVERG